MVNRYRERALEEHLAHDQALISLIQSLAFGFLVTIGYGRITDDPSQAWVILLQAFLIMQCIVVIWQEYWYGTVFLKWTLTISDFWIPFVIGLAEFIMVVAMGSPLFVFFLATAFFAFVGSWALHNQLTQSSRTRYRAENGSILHELRQHHRIAMTGAVAYPLFWLALGAMTYIWHPPIIVLMSLLASNLLVWIHSIMRQRAFNRVLSLDDFPLEAPASGTSTNPH